MVFWFAQLLFVAASLSLQFTCESENSQFNVDVDSVKASQTTNLYCDWKTDLTIEDTTNATLVLPHSIHEPENEQTLPPWLRTTFACAFGFALIWHVGILDSCTQRPERQSCKTSQEPWVNQLHNLTPIQVDNLACDLTLEDEDEEEEEEEEEESYLQPEAPPVLEHQKSDDTFGLLQSPPAKTKEEECVICRIAKKEYAFNPCGHLACCMECAHSVRDCPMCRSPKKSVLKVFTC